MLLIKRERLSYLLISMLLLILIITGSMEIGSLYTGIKQSKTKLNTEISHLLKLAAKENGKITNETTPKMGDYNNRPNLFGSSETRTFRNADTIFSYQHRIADIDTELNQINQHYLLLTDQLHSSDIQVLLDSLLRNSNIKAQTAIGITSTGYPQKNLPWSKDTLRMDIDGRAHYMMEADFTQIHYTAYVEYSFTTLWKRVEDKTAIYVWGIIMLMTLASLIILYIYFPKKKNKAKEIAEHETIAASPEPISIINKEEEKKIEAIAQEETVEAVEELSLNLKIENDDLIFGEKKKRLSPQTKQILQLFLNADNYRVEKTTLKELWPKDVNPTSSMTSAVKRVNDTLKKIGCKSEIITDPENRNFYSLK